ncbi:sensor histidine kinase [Paenibacillus camerounensis]|uniref:sensor histidine kinase n=1 Tax=Paenibacillus camerounensis TaxID=1243663 RepID=UPI001FCAA13D|nr:ATP-binding protein [Paenibacillus camerounensis]
MFVQTRRKLTFTYTWLIILFLILFSLIVSVFFVGMAYRDQRQSLQTTLYASADGNLAVPDLSGTTVEDLYFFYMVDHQGNVLSGSAAFPQNAGANLEKIEEWHPKREAYRLTWLDLPHNGHEGEDRTEHDRLLFMGARPMITEDGRQITVYAAKDVSFYLEVYENLFMVALFILGLFLIAAIWLSYSMSKKAMVPVQHSYQQQQQFLADASHELRTPLSIMNTSLDVIEIENGEDFSAYTKEVVSDMREEVGRMSRMVQHLLLLARSDSENIPFNKESFDLLPKMHQWVTPFETVAHKKNITLSTTISEAFLVKGDIERIKQLVYILLDNAIKYTPEGGTIDVKVERNARQWSLLIKDTGIGIPKDDLERIFDRFYRVEKFRSRDEGSAGLGLPIAKWIVEAHEGSIRAESVFGEGSLFTATFPLALD